MSRCIHHGIVPGRFLPVGLLVLTGCACSLEIYQAEVINDAGREEPLEVLVLCMHPADFDKNANFALRPGSDGLTSRDIWAGSGAGTETEEKFSFDIPQKRVLWFLDGRPKYGHKQGKALRGKKIDPERIRLVKELPFSKHYNKLGVIYVFGRFEKFGEVLPVPPVMFQAPRWGEKLQVWIGVDEKERGRPTEGQVIRAGSS